MLSNATSTTWINQHQRKGKQGEENDRSRSVHTGSGQRRGRAEGRRKVDAHSGQRTAPLAGKTLGAAYHADASPRPPSFSTRSDHVNRLTVAPHLAGTP